MIKQNRRNANETYNDRLGEAFSIYNAERKADGEQPIMFDNALHMVEEGRENAKDGQPMTYGELYLPPDPYLRNKKTGRFLKDHIPYNKGKKWGEYMSQHAQRRAAKGWKILKNVYDLHTLLYPVYPFLILLI